MLIEILTRTPLWVFALFFIVLGTGYVQSKDRVIGRGKVMALPIIFVGLSISGVFTAFGVSYPGIATWLVGMLVAILLGLALGAPRAVAYVAKSRSFAVPGSWVPLTLMMAVFFVKYAVGVLLTLDPSAAASTAIVTGTGFCYGFLSGMFLTRAIVIWRSASQATDVQPAAQGRKVRPS